MHIYSYFMQNILNYAHIYRLLHIKYQCVKIIYNNICLVGIFMEFFKKIFLANKKAFIISFISFILIASIISVAVIIKNTNKENGDLNQDVSSDSSSSVASVESTPEPTPEPEPEPAPKPEFIIASPTASSFTTTKPNITFSGSSVPDLPLTINGTDITRDEKGMFTHSVTLKPGKNTVTVINGEVSKTFSITYKYVVIESYTPNKAQTYKSGSTFVVNVKARAGSTVTATFSGTSITLTKQDKQDEELQGDDTFVVFSGQFTLPGDKRTDTKMGVVKFKATYNGVTEQYSSGEITVKKSSIIKDNDPAVTPQGGRYIDVGSGIVATIVNSSAETFNGDTTDDYSRPTNNYLPKGTMDYCAEGTIIDNNNEYVLLRCGRRVYLNTYQNKSYARAVTETTLGTLPDHNEINVASVETDTRYTYLKLDCLWKAPFYFDILNQSYTSERYQDYTFDTVTYSYIDITFCYTTVFTGTVEIPADHPLFASAEIIKKEYDYTLRLHLKKTGAFYGWDAFYDEDGKLTFKFLHPVKIENQDSLNGTRIFIDIGHGGNDRGAAGLAPSTNPEAVCNLRLANKLREKLEALGATVIMSRTDDSTVDPPDKQEMLRAAEADYCIAIHHDSGTTQSGFGAYHFTPFSKTAADFIDMRMDNTDVFIRDWDVRFHYYFMARMTYCPVVLTENGFVTNAHDYNTTITPEDIEKKAQALCDGILDYFVSIQ